MEKSATTKTFYYLLFLYLLTLPLAGLFILFQPGQGFELQRAVYLLGACLSFTWLALLPPAATACLAGIPWSARRSLLRRLWLTLTALLAGTIHFLLITDLILLKRFGFHINGLVINLLFTPGGIESMGLDIITKTIATLATIAVYAVDAFLVRALLCPTKASAAIAGWPCRRWAVALSAFVLVGSLLLALGMTGVADYKGNASVLSAVDTFPLFPKIRMRKFLRAIKVKEPERQHIVDLAAASGGGTLAYPQNPIVREAQPVKYNVIWLVAESLRADLLSPETMPHAWKLAKTGCLFHRHYSGGHGTRPGMFSMFYGLYGNYWDAFLNISRQPLLFDWLREDGYHFRCQTSAKFSYPEFDRTIFAGMRDDELLETWRVGVPWKRDIVLIDNAIEFMEQQPDEQPFFLFCFFESTHAPYSFDEEAKPLLREEYLTNLNYVTVSPKDTALLYNRDVNAAHHVDSQIGRLLDYLGQRPDVREKTIIVITGDHGEEFYEKGHLGHNSTFVEEQIHVPLVISLPGQPPSQYEDFSHHTDIIPTLAPFFGVRNPPEDFAVGGNLLSPDYHRTSFVTMGWNQGVLVTATHKLILPISQRNFFNSQTVTTVDDEPCPDYQDRFYRDYAEEVLRAQRDMHRFERRR